MKTKKYTNKQKIKYNLFSDWKKCSKGGIRLVYTCDKYKHKVRYAKVKIQDGGRQGGIQRRGDVVVCSSLVLMLALFRFTRATKRRTRQRNNFLFLCLRLCFCLCLRRPGLHVSFLCLHLRLCLCLRRTCKPALNYRL